MDLCVDGNGAFSESLYLGLKTHISLYEALEIEATKCKAGDSRYEFQEWYSKHRDKLKNQRSQGPADVAELDLAVVAKELADAKQAIEEHEAMLADHRAQIIDGGRGLPGPEVDALYATVKSLRAQLPMFEQILRDGVEEGDASDG